MNSVASPPENELQMTPNSIENLSSSEAFIYRSKLPDISISNQIPLHTYCFENISYLCEKPCLITASHGRIYSYSETHLICKKNFRDVIMLLLQNCSEFVFSFLGASMLGAISTTANPFYTQAEIFKQFNSSKTKLIITQSHFVEKTPRLIVTIDDPPQNCLHFSIISDAVQKEIPSVSIEHENPVLLSNSSGTTGLPKGTILTHKSLISNVAQLVDGENPNLYLKSNDVVLCVLPQFHIYALSIVLLCSLRTGTGLVLMQKFVVTLLLELIQRYFPLVQSFDLSSICAILSSAAPLGKELEDALKSRIPQAIIGQAYRMKEAGPVITMSPVLTKQSFPLKSGSSGLVL
ncbi:hypothetical protein MKX01_006619, partial [Papaver californicum]